MIFDLLFKIVAYTICFVLIGFSLMMQLMLCFVVEQKLPYAGAVLAAVSGLFMRRAMTRKG